MTAELRCRLAGLRGPFEAFGGDWTDASLLQPLGMILDLAGEAVRSRLLIVPGAPDDAALRPDFTIPMTRAHIASGRTSGRYLYEGMVFAAPAADDEGAAEHLQIGAESFGTVEDPAMEDAAVAALAWAAASAGGRQDLRVTLGDVGLFSAFLTAIGVGEAAKGRLRSVFTDPQRLAAEINRAQAGEAALVRETPLADLLAELPEAEAGEVLKAIWSLAGIQPVGGRSAAEISHRLAEKARLRRDGPLGAREADLIRRYLAIADAPQAALDQALALASEGGGDLSAAASAWSRRVDAMAASGVPAEGLTFAAAFARPFSYYDGFIFEIWSEALGPEAPLAVGGRYDALPERLGGRAGAVGCMIRPARAVVGRTA